MDFSLNEGEAAVADLAKKIFAERVTPASHKAAEVGGARFDKRLWTDLAEAGLLGIAVPEADGGSGQGLIAIYTLLEQAGRVVAPVPLWETLVLGALPIAEFGKPELRQRLLPGVVSGAVVLTAALVEPNSDDPALPDTTATRTSGGYVLTGIKTSIPAAHHAHRILVSARLGTEGVGLFLVDPKASGVTLDRQVVTTGEAQGHMTLTSVTVPDADVLAEPGKGTKVLDWLLPRATVALCATELGITERVLRMTAEYTTSRHQFERPIATFQAVAQRAADAYVDVETLKVTMWQAAYRIQQGLPASRSVAIAKFWASEAGHRVVYAAQHLHGGMGFDLDYPLHRYYTHSKQIEQTLGGASYQLARLGAEIALD